MWIWIIMNLQSLFLLDPDLGTGTVKLKTVLITAYRNKNVLN